MKVSTTSPSSGFLLAGCQPGGLIATRASLVTRSVGANTSMPSRALQSIRKEMSAGSAASHQLQVSPRRRFQGVALGHVAAGCFGHGGAEVGAAGQQDEVFEEQVFLYVAHVYLAHRAVGQLLERAGARHKHGHAGPHYAQ